MEIYNMLYDFFGFELLTEQATMVDYVNVLLKIGLAVFILCFFIKGLFSCMTNMVHGGNW